MAFNQIVTQENKYTNNQLRELFEIEKNKRINDHIDTQYNFVYRNVIQRATQGINEYHFTIALNPDSYYPNIVYEYDRDNDINIGIVRGSICKQIISMYNINLIDLVQTLFDKIKDTFPEINIGKLKIKNDPRDYYTLSW